jgi:hypothetical protein
VSERGFASLSGERVGDLHASVLEIARVRGMPNRISPRMIGSTTMARSFFRSQATTAARGDGFGSLPAR